MKRFKKSYLYDVMNDVIFFFYKITPQASHLSHSPTTLLFQGALSSYSRNLFQPSIYLMISSCFMLAPF